MPPDPFTALGFKPQQTNDPFASLGFKPVETASPAQPGFIQSTTQSIASPFLKLVASVRRIGDLGTSAVDQVIGNKSASIENANKANEGASQGYDFGYLGKAKPLGVQTNPVSNLTEALGTGAEAGATIASSAIPGSTALKIPAKIALNAGLGATMSGGSSLSQGQSAKDTLVNSLIGGVTGGVATGAAEGIAAVVKKLPNWIAKVALPKLKGDNIDYAIQNTKLGSTASMLQHSNNSVANYADQIRTILAHPEYSDSSFLVREAGKPDVMEQAASAFQNSDYTPESVLATVKDYVPGQAKLVQKIADGTATLAEQNEVRSAIDVANKSVYNTLSRPPEKKAIAQTVADVLRRNIQETAPETAPIFQNLHQELDVNKVLSGLEKKNQARPTLLDIIAGVEGFREGGVLGGIRNIAAERLVRSKGVQMAAAKGANVLSKAAPAIRTIGQKAQVPLVNATSRAKTNQ